MKIISDWFRRFFNDPQAVILTVVLVLGTSVILFMGRDLAPVLASIVIAYLLEGVVQFLRFRLRLPRLLGTILVFVLFLAFVLFLLFGLLPLVSRQLTQLIQQLPNMIVNGQNLLLSLPASYPEFITETQVLGAISAVKAEIATWGQNALTWSLAAGLGVITVVIYLVLVPLLVFFFLKIRSLFWIGSTAFCRVTTRWRSRSGARWTAKWATTCAVSFWRFWWSGWRPTSLSPTWGFSSPCYWL